MDRRDFLKLMALSTAGLYVPKRSFFFMPQTQMKTIEVPMYSGPPSVCMFGDDEWLVPHGFHTVIVNLIVEAKTQIIKSYELPPQLLGDVTKGQLEQALRRRMWSEQNGY